MLLPFLLLAAADCADTSTTRGAREAANGMKACPIVEVQIAKPQRASTAAEIAAVKAYFDQFLRDGPATRWRFEGTWSGGYVCGQINAKNAMGGYTGWQRFWFKDGAGDVSADGRNAWYSPSTIPCLKPSN